MSFGVLFDFTGNSNVSKVIKAATMVNQTWFLNAVNFTEPIDMFVVLGHNPVRPTVSTSTLGTVVNAIRNLRPNTPIQVFGGHTHIRDFVVYDDKATGLESGIGRNDIYDLQETMLTVLKRPLLRNAWLACHVWCKLDKPPGRRPTKQRYKSQYACDESCGQCHHHQLSQQDCNHHGDDLDLAMAEI